MPDLLILLAINSLICLGFWHACDFSDAPEWDELPGNQHRRGVAKELPGKPKRRMVLWWIRWYGGQYLPPWTTKPIYRCLTCMASVHSIVPYAIYTHQGALEPTQAILLWPLYVLALAGVNSLISRI